MENNLRKNPEIDLSQRAEFYRMVGEISRPLSESLRELFGAVIDKIRAPKRELTDDCLTAYLTDD